METNHIKTIIRNFICTKRSFKINLSCKKIFKVGSLCSVLAATVVASQDNYNGNFPVLNTTTSFLRSLKIAFVTSLDYCFSVVGLNPSHSNYQYMMARIHQRAANRLLDGCLKNGGTYIKLGQGLAVMNHILPFEYTKTLTKLQDKCLKKDFNEVKQIFIEDFGKSPTEMFLQFNEQPIAAASLAQVFQAITFDGEKVAVKVQYADLQKRFNGDIATIEFLLNIVGTVYSNFNFAWIIESLKTNLSQELNFINEGKNAELCAKHLSHLKFVYVPKIRWDITSKRILVVEFIDGYKISDKSNLKANNFSLIDIDKKLFEVFGEQIFHTGFVHADPHPGNVLVRKQKGVTQLVLLDHGLYENLTDKVMLTLSHFWKALVLNNWRDMRRYSNEMGVSDYEMFAEILTQSPLRKDNFRLKNSYSKEDIMYMKQFASDRFDVVMQVLKDMPNSLLLVIRNLNTIRSIAQDHGNVINRYNVLARIATKKLYNSKSGNFYSSSKIYFEFKIFLNAVRQWLQRTYIKLLHFLGRTVDADLLLQYIA